MANQKEKSGFMAWYESYKGQRVVGMVYSIGASVVIIGALFKILHWPGASTVLMIGMFTEAFLFLIGCFAHMFSGDVRTAIIQPFPDVLIEFGIRS